MDIRVKYQYTYFIYPFVVEKNEYQKYIKNLLQNPKCSINIFEKAKDLELYTHFSTHITQKMFSTFNLSKRENNILQDTNIKAKEKIIKEMESIHFEYKLDNTNQVPSNEESLFFYIDKIQIICFNTGVCFIAIKTRLDNLEQFSNVLNFNYKFCNILNSDFKKLNNIQIKSDKYEEIDQIKNIIINLTEARECAFQSNELFAYSYVCTDANFWNEQNEFEKISNEFLKFKNILPADYASSFQETEGPLKNTYSKWKYSMYGFSKKGGVVFSSATDTFNFTKLPFYYETVYFYTMILALYKKISEEKIDKITNSEHVENLWNCWGQAFSFEKTKKRVSKNTNTSNAMLEAILGIIVVNIVLILCTIVEKSMLFYPILNLIGCLTIVAMIILNKYKGEK